MRAQGSTRASAAVWWRVAACAVAASAAACAAGALPQGDWVAHGYSEDARSGLRRFLRESVERGEVPGGSLLIVHKGEAILQEGFGWADIRKRRPFSPDLPCSIASLSKPVIATLVVKLASERVLDLDAGVDRYLPEAKGAKLRGGGIVPRAPTLRECLKHVAGFTPDKGAGGRPWLRLKGQGLTLREVVQREIQGGFYYPPGKRFAYSGIGYDVLGRIAEVATGQDLDAALQEHLCKPLGLKHTTYCPDEQVRAAVPRFYWQWRSDGGFRVQVRNPPIPRGEYRAVGGAIVSTPEDMAKFLLLHRNRGVHDGVQVVPEALLREMHTRRRPGSYYGLGFMLGPERDKGLAAYVLHTGSSGTMFWLDFEHDLIGVFFTQCHRSRGRAMPESQKRIPENAPSWPRVAKKRIDGIFGWPQAKRGD